ncbi:hypothetical protein [Botrimarina colliarenosi]|nr:hypothetical protein [Botrimarina colliarenosi]
MNRLAFAAALTLCLFGAAGGACAEGLFAPPTNVDGSPEPLRVAWSCGVSSPGQPVVGRFGLFAPPPLAATELPTEAYACPAPTSDAEGKGSEKKAKEPVIPQVECHPHCVDPYACETPLDTGDFSADAFFAPYDACGELGVYNNKQEIPTQRPLIEWGQPFYGPGPTPIASEALGPTNLVIPKFYVYGDYRVGLAQNDLVGQEQTVLAHRLNLELDYWITSTERVHGFLGPFQRNAQFMRVVDGDFITELDFFQAETDTLFFEGDLGQMLGGIESRYASFDLPVTFGLVPLIFQNGIWAQDALVGGAFTLPAKNSPWLDWSNFDVTFFGGFDRISSGALDFDEDAGAILGATTFVETRGGYFEVGYGYVDDQDGGGRSYHNLGVSYTRRYANLVSNSVRAIFNAGQDANGGRQTADGVLLLCENTFLTENPYNVLPYVNFFAGFDRPQPLARAGVFGGVLFNTGILFQSDQLTGYPTLDATGNNTYGAAVGVDLLSPAFSQQLIIEAAAVKTMGAVGDRVAAGDQVGVGVRWQKKLSTATLIRADAMVGLLDNSDDVSGARVEYRWKF